MADIRVAKPRVGVQIWAYPVDILNIITDQRIIGEVLGVATEDELRELSKNITIEFDRRQPPYDGEQLC